MNALEKLYGLNEFSVLVTDMSIKLWQNKIQWPSIDYSEQQKLVDDLNQVVETMMWLEADHSRMNELSFRVNTENQELKKDIQTLTTSIKNLTNIIKSHE